MTARLQPYIVTKQPLQVLKTNSACQCCDLHEGVKTVCIPTVYTQSALKTSNATLLIVGEAPGADEDQAGLPFVGPSGRRLDELLYASGIYDYADIWISNAVRCRPPGNKTPTAKYINTCAPLYLYPDIATLHNLANKNNRPLHILCAGKTPSSLFGYPALRDALLHSGEYHNLAPLGIPNTKVRVWFVHHPAASLYDPKVLPAIRAQLSLLRTALSAGPCSTTSTGFLIEPNYAVALNPDQFYRDSHPQQPSTVGLDIETYGALRGQRQSVMHPTLSAIWDCTPHHHQIPIAALSIRLKGKDTYRTSIYRLTVPREAAAFIATLHRARTLVLQNASFDLSYLRHWYPNLLVPFETRILDLMLLAYLRDDTSHSYSLDWLSLQYGIVRYGPSLLGHYTGIDDPRLHRYVARDAWATLACADKILASVPYTGGISTTLNGDDRFSPTNLQWWSDAIWYQTIALEQGIRISRTALLALRDRIYNEYLELSASLPDSLKLGTKGRLSALQDIYSEAQQIILEFGDPHSRPAIEHLPLTPTGRLQMSSMTRNLLLAHLPRELPRALELSKILQMYGAANQRWKLYRTYILPLIAGGRLRSLPKRPQFVRRRSKAKGNRWRLKLYPETTHYYSGKGGLTVLPTGHSMIYPRLFLLPHRFGRGGDGGIASGRWSYRDPAIQTWPPAMQHLLISRYKPGHIIGWDGSQMEWRMAAWLSQDATMLREIEQRTDIHSATARALLGQLWDNLPDWISSDHGRRALTTSPSLPMREAAIRYYELPSTEQSAALPEFVDSVRKWLRQSAGKSQNFAWLYGAGVKTVWETCRSHLGFEVPVDRCTRWHSGMQARYPDYYRWLRFLEQAAIAAGGVTYLPVLAIGRTGPPSPDDENWYKFRSIIYDHPIQGCAAWAMQYPVIASARDFLARKLAAHVILQWHDALYIDCSDEAEPAAISIVEHYLDATNNLALVRLRQWIEEHHKHLVPPFPIETERYRL